MIDPARSRGSLALHVDAATKCTGACGAWLASLQQYNWLTQGAGHHFFNAEQARCTASTAETSGVPKRSLFFGAYTPVTKDLWQKRLQALGDPKAGSLPPVVEKRAEPISVTYPLTSDPEFLEMVSYT